MSGQGEFESSTRSDRRKQSTDSPQWPIVAVAVLAIVAIGLAGWVLLRPGSTAGSSIGEVATYTDAQRADGRAKTCAAFGTVRKGVNVNTNLQAPGGEGDVVGVLAVAANARLSLFEGGQYLLARLDPAAPPELAGAIRSFANTLMDVGAAATAGALNTDPDQATRLRDAGAADTSIAALCA